MQPRFAVVESNLPSILKSKRRYDERHNWIIFDKNTSRAWNRRKNGRLVVLFERVSKNIFSRIARAVQTMGRQPKTRRTQRPNYESLSIRISTRSNEKCLSLTRATSHLLYHLENDRVCCTRSPFKCLRRCNSVVPRITETRTISSIIQFQIVEAFVPSLYPIPTVSNGT